MWLDEDVVAQVPGEVAMKKRMKFPHRKYWCYIVQIYSFITQWHKHMPDFGMGLGGHSMHCQGHD